MFLRFLADRQPASANYIAEIVLASLSILGTFFVLFVFICYKNLRTWPFEQAFYLCFSSMINSISYMLYYTDKTDTIPESDNEICKIQGFIMIWFENSQYLWAMLIGFSIYHSIVLIKDDPDVDTSACKRSGYILFAFGIPLIFSILAISFNQIGPMGNWCWIGDLRNEPSDNYNTNLRETVEMSKGSRIISWLFMGFFVLVISLNWFFIYSTIRSLNSEFNSPEERKIIGGYIRKISLYPLIQTICMIPSLVNKLIITVFLIEYTWLNVIQALMVSSQGLWYAIVYGCNTKVKQAIRETLDRRFCCIERKRTSIVTDLKSENELNKSDRRMSDDEYNFA